MTAQRLNRATPWPTVLSRGGAAVSQTAAGEISEGSARSGATANLTADALTSATRPNSGRYAPDRTARPSLGASK